MPVVTISREYGAGGLHVGRRVAERLGLDFLDSVLIEETARRLRIPEDAVRRWDERREGLVLRVLRAMRTAHPEYASGEAWSEVEEATADPERIGRATRAIIEELGRAGNAVIVGRGAAFILPAGPGVHHFRIVAPRQFRIRWLIQQGISGEEMEREIDRIDRERLAFVRHRFGADAREAGHYCLVINTGCLPPDAAADLIVGIVAGARPGFDGPSGA
jgi:cytidylate kinase